MKIIYVLIIALLLSPAVYANDYLKVIDTAISGANDFPLTDVTVSACKVACSSDTLCRSFDYVKAEERCDLSYSTFSEVANANQLTDDDRFDHYARIPDRYERIANAAIRGANDVPLTDVTVSACQFRCSSDTMCRSFDYVKAEDRCDLSYSTFSEVANANQLTDDDRFDYYEKLGRYERIANAAISGANDVPLTDVTVSACQIECSNDTLCRSFDYVKAENRCDLSYSTFSEVAIANQLTDDDRFDYYEKRQSTLIALETLEYESKNPTSAVIHGAISIGSAANETDASIISKSATANAGDSIRVEFEIEPGDDDSEDATIIVAILDQGVWTVLNGSDGLFYLWNMQDSGATWFRQNIPITNPYHVGVAAGDEPGENGLPPTALELLQSCLLRCEGFSIDTATAARDLDIDIHLGYIIDGIVYWNEEPLELAITDN